VTIVFDGAPGIYGTPYVGNVKVVFSNQKTADDEIKDIVEKAANKKQIVVVTDDREIKYYVRPLGATVLSVKDFLSKCQPRLSRGPSHPKASIAVKGAKKRIPSATGSKITKELEKIWIKKEKDK